MRRPVILLGLLPLLAACGAAEPIRFQAQTEEIRAMSTSLSDYAREGWHLPLAVRVFFSNEEDGVDLPPDQEAREQELALTQLAEVKTAYGRSPFDLYAVDVRIGHTPKVKVHGEELRLEIRLATPEGEAVRIATADEILEALAEAYRWKRGVKWYEGERVETLTKALRRDLGKIAELEDALALECHRLEMLASSVRSRAPDQDGEVLLTPAETEYARGAQFRTAYALHRLLNTLGRWRLAADDETLSLRDEALAAVVHGRFTFEGAVGWLLEIIVPERPVLKFWESEWWHRSALYKVLDSEASIVVASEGSAPVSIPAGSIGRLLSLSRQDDLQEWFGELDRAWEEHDKKFRGSALETEVRRSLDRIPAARNLAREKERGTFSAWKEVWDARIKNTVKFPLYHAVAGISRMLGDTRVIHPDPGVSPAQLKKIAGLLEPGDVILVRQDHYLSNAFLPGFWPHALLYLGPEREWTQLKLADGSRLGDDPVVRRLLPEFREPEAGKPRRVIEAISEGVVFSSLEHAVQKDYVVVLRPKISEAEIAAGIADALTFHGREYDFDFDFATDDKVVCTELVYRAYDTSLNFQAELVRARVQPAVEGTKPPARVPGLLPVMGRLTMPANEIARYVLYMDENPEPRPAYRYPGKRLELIVLLDLREGEERCRWYEGAEALKVLKESVDR